ncbi:ABC transporter permease [Streptomyces sp. ZAF1911]|uniref:ABC transporter permease n=1 Tax=Streptomyces sp. ZAF1911 TaxID=2944129 RepID=UPI00237AAE61|nr:ABC transporter permease [Streptomyces sp. ZAF1911]MDD9378888.1 ABC transporter permease [Streptomyces sp. ZAF1911]
MLSRIRRAPDDAFPQSDIGRSLFAPRDLLAEALAGMLQRPARSALTMLGTVLGVGAFVAVLGLTATASSQIDDRFNVLSATEVTVEDIAHEQDKFAGPAFPDDATDRVERLNGVRHAGVLWMVKPRRSAAELAVTAAPVGGAGGEALSVVAAAPAALRAAEPRLSQGRLYDDFHAGARQRVTVISSGIAARLGITTLETEPAIFIGGQPFTVIGIVEDVERQPDVLLSVLVPQTTAVEMWGRPAEGARMLIATDLGAAGQVAAETPTALRPDHPEYLKAVPPPDPKSLRTSVTSDLEQLFLLLAGVCLVIGAVGIANTTLVAVLERTGEIGLRRALGAQKRHVTAQFLAESGTLGAFGGLIGTSIGTLSVLVVALIRDWTPVMHPITLATAPLIGLATGIVAGIYPARRASSVQPADALRG